VRGESTTAAGPPDFVPAQANCTQSVGGRLAQRRSCAGGRV